MKITYLVPNVYGLGGTERAIVTQANSLARFHEVEILSVYRKAERPHFAIGQDVSVRSLVSVIPGEPPRSRRPGLLDERTAESLQDRPSVMLPPVWDPSYDALADVVLEDELPRVTSDVLVTVAPALLAAATQLVPGRTAIVHQEHRSSSQRTAGMEPLLVFGPRADVIVLLTVSMADWLADRLGRDAPAIEVVRNTLPPGYRPVSRLDNPLIVAAGRLVSEKQYGQLISAFALISSEIPEWRLRIFGDGTARPGLTGVIRLLGLYDRVEMPGTTRDLAEEWAKASVSALTSTTEGFPLVIQEAMAAGVPVVSYDCPSGPREIIDHGVNGFLVAQSSETGMAAALHRLATDSSLRVRMGAAAIEKARVYDADVINQRWLEIFEATVNRRRRLPADRATRHLVSTATHGDSPATANPDNALSGTEGLGVSPAEARRAIMRWLSGVASSTSDTWFVMPASGDGEPVVVVPMSNRRPFLDGMAAGDNPAYVSVRDPAEGGWPGRRGSVVEMVSYLRSTMTPRLAVEPWPLVDGHPSVLGQGCTTWVEFWETGVEGELHAILPNPYVQRAPATRPTSTTTVEGAVVPTLTVMVGPTVSECRFPVDVVYTWVDGADPAWNEARLRRLAEVTDETMLSRAASGLARFKARDELRYSMRSVHLFAPWVRTVHLVTDGQTPSWLVHGHPRVRVVDHKEILPAEALPTYNSQAIETALRRIPDLAEHFIYFNDDVFLGRPVRPEMFFSPAGECAVFPSPVVVGLPGQGDRPFLKAGENNRMLLEEAFGVTITSTIAHTPHAHRRSLLDEIAERFAGAVGATAQAPFRSDRDVSMLSSLAQHYGLITGEAFVGDAEWTYVSLTSHNLKRKLDTLLLRDHDCFCLNDYHGYAMAPARVDMLVAGFLEAYFPVAAPWEDNEAGPSRAL